MSNSHALPTSSHAGRHACYRAIVRLLRHDADVPSAVRATRFFDAAERVTAAIGRLRRWGSLARPFERLGLLDPGARRHLEAINAWLLERNLDVLGLVLLDWRELRSPSTGTGPALEPAAFDAAMVVYEQQAIDDYLAQHPPSASERRDIDRLLAFCAAASWCAPVLGVDWRLCEAVRAAYRQADRRRGAASFFAIDTRIAIGHALVRRVG